MPPPDSTTTLQYNNPHQQATKIVTNRLHKNLNQNKALKLQMQYFINGGAMKSELYLKKFTFTAKFKCDDLHHIMPFHQ